MRTEKTVQTERMPRLIRVFAGRTYHFVGFDMQWLIYKCHGEVRGDGLRPPHGIDISCSEGQYL